MALLRVSQAIRVLRNGLALCAVVSALGVGVASAQEVGFVGRPGGGVGGVGVTVPIPGGGSGTCIVTEGGLYCDVQGQPVLVVPIDARAALSCNRSGAVSFEVSFQADSACVTAAGCVLSTPIDGVRLRCNSQNGGQSVECAVEARRGSSWIRVGGFTWIPGQVVRVVLSCVGDAADRVGDGLKDIATSPRWRPDGPGFGPTGPGSDGEQFLSWSIPIR